MPGARLERELMENSMGDNQTEREQGNENDVGTNDAMNEIVEDVVIQPDPPKNIRPKRDRKENVRYSSQEYDLSAVFNSFGGLKLTLSGVYVQKQKMMKKHWRRS